MLNIIKSDLYRIFKGKAIYISFLVIIAMMTLSCFELSPGYIGMSSGNLPNSTLPRYEDILTDEELEKFYQTKSIKEEREFLKKFPYELDKVILGENTNLYYLFIVIVVVVLATDFSNNTVKNTISSAISRKKYYIAKLITSILLCTILILFNNYGAYILNLIMNGKEFSSNIIEITKITLYQLPLMYGIISVLVCISTVSKKTAIFNTTSIPLLMVCQLILIGIISLFKIKPDIMNWEYQVALGKLATNPAKEYIIQCILLGIAYIVIFNTIGYKTFKKSEIK